MKSNRIDLRSSKEEEGHRLGNQSYQVAEFKIACLEVCPKSSLGLKYNVAKKSMKIETQCPLFKIRSHQVSEFEI